MSLYNFKVVLLGQDSVGKTSLILRYIADVFNDSHQSTLQASFLKKQLYLDQDLVKLNVWDTAGQERFHALGPLYCRGANGALLVYDVTSPNSLHKVREWVKELNKMLGVENVRLAIVGNKLDMLAQQNNPQNSPLIQEAVQLTNELRNARHYLTSAKLNLGLADLFVSLSKQLIEQCQRDKSSLGSQIQKSLPFAEETCGARNHRPARLASSRVNLASAINQKGAISNSSCSRSCWR